jgi:hypothetical protein
MGLVSAFRKILHLPCSGEVRQAAQISAAGSRHVQRAAQRSRIHAEQVEQEVQSYIREPRPEDALDDLVGFMAGKRNEESR